MIGPGTVTIIIGITRKRRDTQALLSLRNRNPFPSRGASASRNMIMREGCLPWSIQIFILLPNSQRDLARLDYRMNWEEAFRAYLTGLKASKSVIVCGDMNVAHQEIDLKNPKTNHHNAGFTDEEREKFSRLLDAGFVDTFRHFYPDMTGAYSWWSYMFHAREKNAGWRIDYFLVSEDLKSRLQDAAILAEIYGSDHCPVQLTIH